MKKSDLHREWARVLDMCEGTNVDPAFCWKFNGEIKEREPYFDSVGNYDFMVAILEDRPVFVGDKVYWKHDGSEFEWGIVNHRLFSWSNNLTRTPPKRTFTLNGVELPRPSKTGKVSFGFASDLIGFESYSDAEKVASAIKRILEDATKC